MSARVLAIALASSACMQPTAQSCGDRECEAGDVCTPNGCATPAALDACTPFDVVLDAVVPAAEGAPCTFHPTGYANAACLAGACIATTWQVTVASDGATPFAGSDWPATGLAADATGAIYVADAVDHRVLQIDPAGAIATVAGTGSACASATQACGDGGAATSAQLASPSGVAIDASGTLYVADTGDNRIRRIAAGVITTIAGTGEHGFADGTGSAAELRGPTGLFFDAATSTLYIADTGNHVIRTLDPATGTVSTIAGTPQTLGDDGDGSAATAATLYEPGAVTACGSAVFIADTGNNRVRRVDAATGMITTVLGDGTASSSGAGLPATQFPVNRPLGLACDPAGNLVVTSRTTVRLVGANAGGALDGGGSVQTIFDAPQPHAAPADTCLSGAAVIDATHVRVADACAASLVELARIVTP